MCLFRVKKTMRLVYCVISCDGLGGSIACAWNSQMASSLSQIWVACSTMKMSSFQREIKKNIQAMKSYANPRLKKSLTAPRFSFCTDQPTSLVFGLNCAYATFYAYALPFNVLLILLILIGSMRTLKVGSF